MASRVKSAGWISRLGISAGVVVAAVSCIRHPGTQAADVPVAQWAQYQTEAPKNILELQPFRTESEVGTENDNEESGRARLINLNPAIDVWFVLRIKGAGASTPVDFHLENPRPARQSPRLVEGPRNEVLVTGLVGGGPCELWRADPPGTDHPVTLLEQAARSGLPYVPLCDGRLYLRNTVAGHRTSLEKTTGFLRDHVYGGEEVISFVKKQVYRDAFLERVERSPTGSVCQSPDVASAARPLDAAVSAETGAGCITPANLALDLEKETSAGLSPGRWYTVRDLPGIYASTLMPADLTEQLLSGIETGVNRLDPVESNALVYLVAFDLTQFDLHFAMGTEHPRLDWSPRPPARVRDVRLPGPDGIASTAPLVMNGLVSPAEANRTVASFAGGFKREHGAFRYGPLSLANHGSHYGFIQEGVILSKLQPGLATLLAFKDGRVELKTWMAADDTSLNSVRYARQNGVPLIEYDPTRGVGMPGALVGAWGPGNWSGSADEALRTLRAGACVQQTGTRRFLIYGYFSSATPSAMARVFQGYSCRYAMQLDMNALEHTYLALYVRRNRMRLLEHLVRGMEQCDSRTHTGLAPRFLAAPDDRDFFYLTRREPPHP